MSSFPRATTDTGEDQDVMDTDPEPGPSTTVSNPAENDGSWAMLLQDSANWLPKIRALKETDLIILLTPVVMPADREASVVSDPFEPLGRSLAKRHARVRHVPYIQRNGLTSTHLAFVQRGHAIILCLVVQPSNRILLELADVLLASHDHKPYVIIICFSEETHLPGQKHQEIPFPTTILTKGYSPPALEAAASLIFSPSSTSTTPSSSAILSTRSLQSPHPASSLPQHTLPNWQVHPLSDPPTTEIPEVHSLWTESLPARFSLPPSTLSSLLHRPGYAKHYIVRLIQPPSLSSPPNTNPTPIIAFAATYLTYFDREGEDLLASLAILLVHPHFRGQGIGRALHDHALRELGKTRGIRRFQLGSAFPRLLAGPVVGMGREAEEWFRRRGWGMRKNDTGEERGGPRGEGGGVVRDMIVDGADWEWKGAEGEGEGGGGLKFRMATQEDMIQVLEFVDDTAKRMGRMGWFDQYAALMGTANVKEVVLGLHPGDASIFTAALTYTPISGSQIAANLPWAGRAGDDVGGVTCICIRGSGGEEAAAAEARRLLPPLLDVCMQTLRMAGMRKMFLDACSEDDIDDLKKLGFKEWAAYRDVWRDT